MSRKNRIEFYVSISRQEAIDRIASAVERKSFWGESGQKDFVARISKDAFTIWKRRKTTTFDRDDWNTYTPALCGKIKGSKIEACIRKPFAWVFWVFEAVWVMSVLFLAVKLSNIRMLILYCTAGTVAFSLIVPIIAIYSNRSTEKDLVEFFENLFADVRMISSDRGLLSSSDVIKG